MPLAIPVQQEVARKTSIALFPKNWASHLLRGECQVVRIGKKSPEWRWLEDKEGKSHENRAKEGLRTRVRTSDRTNSTPGQPNLHRESPRGGKKHIERGAKWLGVSLSNVRLLALSYLCIFCVGMPSCLEDVFSFYFLNKTELYHRAVTLICPRAITWSV